MTRRKLPQAISRNTCAVTRNVLFLLLFALSPVFAQAPFGMPLLQRYTGDHYPALPSHFAVVSDSRGRIFLGNSEGVLVFDGQRWELLELPLGGVARALVVGADDRIYVGSYDHFGVVEEAETGALRYTDLRPLFDLGPDEINLAEIWDVLETPSGVYFRAAKRLLFLGYDGRTRHWPLSEEVRGFSAVGDALYARLDGKGLMRWSDGNFTPEPGAERFANQPLYKLFPRAEGRLLVSSKGFFLADDQGIKQIDVPAAEIFAQDEPYTGIELPDGSYALGTFGGRVLWFSADLRLMGSYPISAYTVLGMGLDREGGLWLATEGEAVRLRLPSPWSRFGPEEGLRGGLYTSRWHDAALWVATSNGVMRAHQNGGNMRFDLAVVTSLEANALESTASGLLIGDRDGLLLLRPGQTKAERIYADEAIFTLSAPPGISDRLYAIGEKSIFLFRQDAQGWRMAQRWPLEGMQVSSMHELDPGRLWVGDYRGWPQRWYLDLQTGERRIEVMGPESGLVLDAPHGAALLQIDDNYYAVSGQSCFSWRDTRFEAGCPAPFDRVESPDELTIARTDAGLFAYTSRELWLRRSGSSEWQPLHISAGLGHGFANVHGGSDGMVRIATWSGLLQFDPSASEPPAPALQARLRRAQLLDSEGNATALSLDPRAEDALPPRATLQLDFQLVGMQGAPQFRYRIEGLQPQWSAWGTDDSLSLRELPHGDFELQLEARTRAGRSAAPYSYGFEVQPLWWETRWARAGAVLLLIIVIVALVQLMAWLRLRNYALQTRRLEQRIAARTTELQEANRRLAEMATVDSLTGVANRRALEHGLAREWQRCQDTDRPIAALMLDIDHFKQFNDRYGHLEGDEKLRWVGGELAGLCDSSRELLARFGGEEFVLILPGCDLEAAHARAQTIHSHFDQPASSIRLSIGVAAIIPPDPRSAEDMLRAADTALYDAKRKGRNRVEVAR